MDNLINNKAAMFGAAVIAFLIAAALVIMIFRMLFGGRLKMPGGRARQARLGIVDAFDLDRQRQLIIVRRDNTEHLIMIGGPNDLVIESEIVRAEARDLRDARREPGITATMTEGRIPAPPPALDKPDAPAVAPAPTSAPAKVANGRPADEPMLPMPMPPAPEPISATAASMPTPETRTPEPQRGPEPPRAPTFPLPPRRPPPEPRPIVPPRLPESVSRGDEVPSLSGQPPAPAPAPPVPMAPPAPAAAPEGPSVPAAPPAGPVPAPPSATPPTRPPFLKPLTPRPPIRPLQRTTPQPAPAPTMPGTTGTQNGAPPAGRPPIAGQPPAAAPPPRSVGPMESPRPPSPPRVAPAPPSPPPAAPPQAPTDIKEEDDAKDALESLEEEMAKLLGRGS